MGDKRQANNDSAIFQKSQSTKAAGNALQKISTHNLNYLPYSALIYEEFEENEAQIFR